jgi:hypothetical protein
VGETETWNFIVTQLRENSGQETHEEELATEDATDLGDFAADIAEQPLEDIETSEEETEEYQLNLSFF